MENTEEGSNYIVVGKRMLKVVEHYGEKPIDEILLDAIQYIFDNPTKEDSNARNRIGSKI